MIILRGLEEVRERYQNPVVTIGNFDGVHLGHQALFEKTTERAKELGGTSLAMTFEPHPMRVLRPAVNLPLINTLEQKTRLIEKCGLDVLISVRFDEDFAALSADDFVDKLLVGRLGVSEVVIGYDFAFGKKGLGDAELLRSKEKQSHITTHVVGPVIMEGRPISSTRVRQVVRACDVKTARKLLGRFYRISGKVITGHGRGGRLLGFPTANLKVRDELLPGPGVYAVLAQLESGKRLVGVTNVGKNPTFGDSGLSVETHILDFDEDLYGQDMKVDFVEHLRPEKKFSSAEELVKGISADVAKARKILANFLPG
ncbi:bifunctional riboflavin kinase/FAD synthetase [Dethiosulfatarculus sandiegensis]|uniref:Riboflavin biosynthesis protein n=1 Tax=Dethiosulfatarculus sandiegensis TaxID=1429043 RepID=A0A0D2JZV3_9BACT|nr:bifunctional riboflavin kinase/FAD synthetase [Dethiosulfatarculus sandiegensis]KIX15015.1 riboflavin biosynthesis protein RibF [Dethiosulfatarculus sandiegensis]